MNTHRSLERHLTRIIGILVILYIPLALGQSYSANNAGWISSGLTNDELPRVSAQKIQSRAVESADNYFPASGELLPFKYYITPEIGTVNSKNIDSLDEAYQTAVRWVYVSEKRLNGVEDKWLTPGEFLTGTPHYPNNPLQGKAVSDCEEQANTLVSYIRALGTSPDEVRAVVGTVLFNDKKTGHVWAEVYVDREWLILDPTCGPYWDDSSNELVARRGLPFDYYANHPYPVLEVWGYYNDLYQIDFINGLDNAPAFWLRDAPGIDLNPLSGPATAR